MIRFLVKRKLISNMSILTENLAKTNYKQGKIIENFEFSHHFALTVALFEG
jgi:hypothetical protein